MAAALFIATPKVRHLATWTADKAGDTGHVHVRAICGGAPWTSNGDIYDTRTVDAPEYLDPAWRRSFDAAMRRPVCRRCLTTLAALTDLTTRSQS